MPKLSGKDVISEATEKAIRRAMLIGGTATLAKLYDVPLKDLNVLGIELPSALFDTVLLVLVVYSAYSLVISWASDLMAFRLWYRESSLWSEFGTNMKLDKSFIRGAVPLLLKLHALEKTRLWPVDYSALDENVRKEFDDFKTNVELYCTRLEYAGTRFKMLSVFGHYYVWFQSFTLPVGLCCIAAYLLLKWGTFALPSRM